MLSASYSMYLFYDPYLTDLSLHQIRSEATENHQFKGHIPYQ